MSLVIDASVFVAFARAAEEKRDVSRRFLARTEVDGEKLYAPSLVFAECACAIARHTNSSEKAKQMVLLLKEIPGLQTEPVTDALAESAAELGGACRLRGSDACYLALAALVGASLISWDLELVERGASVVRTCTPEQWLDDQTQSA